MSKIIEAQYLTSKDGKPSGNIIVKEVSKNCSSITEFSNNGTPYYRVFISGITITKEAGKNLRELYQTDKELYWEIKTTNETYKTGAVLSVTKAGSFDVCFQIPQQFVKVL